MVQEVSLVCAECGGKYGGSARGSKCRGGVMENPGVFGKTLADFERA